MAKGAPWPVQLRLIRAEKRIEIEFDDGKKFSLPAEYLRVESPSAEVQGHDPSHKVTVPGRAHVGIFSWDYLYQLGVEQPKRWRDYLKALQDKGLSREPGRG